MAEAILAVDIPAALGLLAEDLPEAAVLAEVRSEAEAHPGDGNNSLRNKKRRKPG